MRKGRVAFLSLIMVVMMTNTCFAFEVGGKAGLLYPMGKYDNYSNSGYTFGFQVKKPLTETFSIGVNADFFKSDGGGYPKSNRFGIRHNLSFKAFQIFPFIDMSLWQRSGHKIFLRGGLGLNRWEAEVSGKKDIDDDLMFAVGLGVNLFRNIEILALFNQIQSSNRYMEEIFNTKTDYWSYHTVTIGYNFDLSSKIEAQF